MGVTTEVTINTQTGPDAPVVDNRPDNVPEKFWDAEKGAVRTEALLESYASLEGKLGGKPDETTNEAEGSDKEAIAEGSADEDAEGDEARKVAEAAGLDIPALETHWEEHGSLPDDTYEKLASVGVDKGTVDEFVQYRLAQAETVRAEMLGTVGGEEAVNKMVEWAAQNYSQEKADAFNEGVNSKNKGKIELALKALKADFDKAKGVRPKLLTPTNEGGPKGARYASMEEMMADQRKPQYRTDPAFRKQVMDKLARSDF